MPYEIVMHGPYGDEQVDSEITSRSYGREQVNEHRLADPHHTYSFRFQRPTRYYVKPSGGAWYDADTLKGFVLNALDHGGITRANVRTARQFGWSNQPSVVTFSGYSKAERAVSDALRSHGFMVIVHEKDW